MILISIIISGIRVETKFITNSTTSSDYSKIVNAKGIYEILKMQLQFCLLRF